jgi:hypothetical protein
MRSKTARPLDARRHRLDADQLQCFIQSREPFRRHRLAVDARGAGTGVKPLPYPHQLAYQRLI